MLSRLIAGATFDIVSSADSCQEFPGSTVVRDALP